jgi:glycosyltransferase involved in cell wall biosynthesis
MSSNLESQAERSRHRAGELDGAVDTGPGKVLRVLHLLWSGETGGMERAVYQLAREQLASDSISPAVLFPGPRGPYYERLVQLGLPVTSLGLPHARSLGQLTVARRAMQGFDIHHFHAAEPLLMVASAGCRGTARVYTHRGGVGGDDTFKRRLRFRITGALLRSSFHAFSGNTAHGARAGAAFLRIDPDRFEVTYNGIDFSLLDPRRQPSEVRTELGLTGEFVLGTAAILKSWKRIDRLLHALRALRETPGRPARLVVVGDGPERGRLEALARELGIAGDVTFTGLQDHVADYLQVMDAFCLPSSEKESFGNAAIEAMATGVPTIVFADSPGLLEHVDDGRTGFVVETQEELVEVLQRLRADAAAGADVARQGRDEIRARYTPARAARAYEQLYASALAARAG